MSKYPPCMMHPDMYFRQEKPKKEKSVSFLKDYIAFQKFLKEMETGKKEEHKSAKGQWHWVEEAPSPSKFSVMETMGIMMLLSIPIAAVEVAMGNYLMRLVIG